MYIFDAINLAYLYDPNDPPETSETSETSDKFDNFKNNPADL